MSNLSKAKAMTSKSRVSKRAMYREKQSLITEIPTIIDPVALWYFLVAPGSIMVEISVILFMSFKLLL
jgi:hypothetical protein